MTPEAKLKVLELVSEAIDKGGKLNIHFSQFDQSNNWKPVLRDDIESKVEKIALLLSTINKEHKGDIADRLIIDTNDVRICFSYLTPNHKDYKDNN